ncbi:hypothetical protein LJC55_01310 [Eubacteriales bacterium OttesenSCG-928-N14]|nr:hypothetical protein [Eubacteriales bacterium OttesenSCG-928-N14]
MRTELTDGVVSYFKSEHWNNFVNNHVDNPTDEIWHSHVYVDTSIHPDSLEPVMYDFFIKWGHPLVRHIDQLSATPGVGALHNVHPQGLAHFDMFFRYYEDAVLQPMRVELAEKGQNALSWGKAFMDDFYKKFDFKAVGPREEQQIREFFHSLHWKDFMRHAKHPNVMHVHCNVKINFDPKILELIARDTLAAQGWTIDKVVPNVYNVRGEYTGKLVFLGASPEIVYDLAWVYDPDVVIAPCYETLLRDDFYPGFDPCLNDEYAKVLAESPFIRLTEEEIADIISRL